MPHLTAEPVGRRPRPAAARPAVEIAVQSIAGVETALAAGADRIELCSALSVGGMTPSMGLIEAAVEAAARQGATNFVNVLVRAREGGFVYDDDDLGVMERDVLAARRAGASGIVTGALTADGLVDHRALRLLRDAAGGMQVTFHRAIDVLADPIDAARELAAVGVDRILTSGGRPTSIEGLATLGRLAREVGASIEIMAGGGVAVEDIPALADAGVAAVHLSARLAAETTPSGPGGGASVMAITDRATVDAAVAAARRARAGNPASSGFGRRRADR